MKSSILATDGLNKQVLLQGTMTSH